MKKSISLCLIVLTLGYSSQSHAFLPYVGLYLSGLVRGLATGEVQRGMIKKLARRSRVNGAPNKVTFDCKLSFSMDGETTIQRLSIPVVKNKQQALYFFADSFKEGRKGEKFDFWGVGSQHKLYVKNFRLPNELSDRGIEVMGIGIFNTCNDIGAEMSFFLGEIVWEDSQNYLEKTIAKHGHRVECLNSQKTYNLNKKAQKDGHNYEVSLSCKRR